MKVGERIKSRRLELGLSVEEVAQRIGKSKATVYRYENDDIENLPFTVLEPLAKVLETTPGELLGWRKDENEMDNPVEEEIRSIAAHATRKLTDEEIEEIRNFAKYIIQRDKK